MSHPYISDATIRSERKHWRDDDPEQSITGMFCEKKQ